MTKRNPYIGLNDRAFWKKSVSDLNPLAYEALYMPKFAIGKSMGIAAAGSCFAQHIGRQFKNRGYQFLDTDPPPSGLPAALWHRYGYDLYSARYGNVYSMRQLLQLVQRAFGAFEPVERVWHQKGRFFDPFRPAIEPDGFASKEEFDAINASLMTGVRTLIATAEVFVFTFGLTESWISREDGAVFPACPGTVAGEFDETRHRFHNFRFAEVMEDACHFIEFARRRNPKLQFLFTVSPVPLVATASGNHVLQASVHSKSVLRAVCGELQQMFEYADYFPSYEMVASHAYRAMFFNPDLRTVAEQGVAHVMDSFFRAHGEIGGAADIEGGQLGPSDDSGSESEHQDDVVCEELVLERFGK